MYAANIAKLRCTCNVLITREAQKLKKHRGSCVELFFREMQKVRTRWR